MSIGNKICIGKKVIFSQFQETNKPVRLKSIVENHDAMLALTDIEDGDMIIVKDDSSFNTEHKQFSYIYFNSNFEPFIEIELQAIENIVFADKYSNLLTLDTTTDQLGYVKNDEIIDTVEYKKGIYVYTDSKWNRLNTDSIINDTLDKDSAQDNKVKNTYSINMILNLLSQKENNIYKQDTEPTDKKENDIWINISKQEMSIYNGTEWISIGKSSNTTIDIASATSDGLMSKENFSLLQTLNDDVTDMKETFIDKTPIIESHIKDNTGSISVNMGDNYIKQIFTDNNGTFSTPLDTSSKQLVMTINFGEKINFNTIGIITGYGCPNNFDIYTSSDGNTYTKVDEIRALSKYNTWVANKEILFFTSNINTQYLKIEYNSVFKNHNRYQFRQLKFYFNEDFNSEKFKEYNNIDKVPYYYRSEAYSKEEIDYMLSNFNYLGDTIKNITADSGSYTSGKYASVVDTSTKQIKVTINLNNKIEFNALSLDGTGYGGVNNFDIYSSDDGTTFNLIQSVNNANIYTNNETKYICFKNLVNTQYVRLLLKTNVSGNRYEFKNPKFYYDRKIDNTPCKDYVNKDILESSGSSEPSITITQMTQEELDTFLSTLE